MQRLRKISRIPEDFAAAKTIEKMVLGQHDEMAKTQNINVSACHSAVDAMLYSTTFQQQMWFFCLTILIDWQSVKIDICNEFILAPPNKRL
ncbi:hypothetical protein H2N74_02765 [Bacillus velezensis]|uniref:hypothetical protein n=1 Tax=Bacillus velezensis TaxID=492670 RepID=UPI0015F565A5|nr:hypothetical protein [Bacillus velezensis]QMT21481.1 hypothetical protein H2N74_02765 [Bacillus velezensis]